MSDTYTLQEELEKLIKAGDAMADLLVWFINERDKGSKYITAVPRIGIELALEDWDYYKNTVRQAE